MKDKRKKLMLLLADLFILLRKNHVLKLLEKF